MNNIQRTFIIGDTWSYFKLYTGFKTADKILTDLIYPLSQQLLQQKIIDKWFFIRYSDPKFHLRIRFHTDDVSKTGIIINAFNKAIKQYVSNDLVWKVQTDTYNRELERYGAENIENSEFIFWHDSEMICKILYVNEVKQDENLRWLLALKMIDVLLNSFHYTLKDKYNLLKKLHEDFSKEFNISTNAGKKQFADKYRTERNKIEEIINLDINSKLVVPVYEKQEQTKDVINRIIEQNEDKNTLLSSYIHMMLNRLFRTQQRKYELVLYDFLSIYYTSEIAKSKTVISSPCKTCADFEECRSLN